MTTTISISPTIDFASQTAGQFRFSANSLIQLLAIGDVVVFQVAKIEQLTGISTWNYTATGGDIQAKIGAIVVAGLDVAFVTAGEDRSAAVGQGYNIGEYKAPEDGQDFMIYSQSGEFLDGDGTITVTLLYNLF